MGRQLFSSTSGELLVTEDLTINGPGKQLLTISGEESSRILHGSTMSGDVDLTLRDVTLSGGYTNYERESGAAIWLERNGFDNGTLTLERVTIQNNVAKVTSLAAETLAAWQVDVLDSVVTGNETFGQSSNGGAIRGWTG